MSEYILPLSNLATMLITAWVIHCAKTGRSPVPSFPAKVQVHENNDPEPIHEKGRPIL